ncbi:hypothetical protein HanRHA438_Chr09g0396031 [Helianthus annuus]|nr:hypothetical protein HanRHA438_Chr09g0396031 [Helianthus annuus]
MAIWVGEYCFNFHIGNGLLCHRIFYFFITISCHLILIFITSSLNLALLYYLTIFIYDIDDPWSKNVYQPWVFVA